MVVGRVSDLVTYRLANQKTVSTVRSGVLQSRYGQFKVAAYQDTIHQRVHLALTVGDIRADHPTLVRVHVTAVFRDLIGTTIEGHASWSFDASLRAIAEADAGCWCYSANPRRPRI